MNKKYAAAVLKLFPVSKTQYNYYWTLNYGEKSLCSWCWTPAILYIHIWKNKKKNAWKKEKLLKKILFKIPIELFKRFSNATVLILYNMNRKHTIYNNNVSLEFVVQNIKNTLWRGKKIGKIVSQYMVDKKAKKMVLAEVLHMSLCQLKRLLADFAFKLNVCSFYFFVSYCILVIQKHTLLFMLESQRIKRIKYWYF